MFRFSFLFVLVSVRTHRTHNVLFVDWVKRQNANVHADRAVISSGDNRCVWVRARACKISQSVSIWTMHIDVDNQINDIFVDQLIFKRF